MSVKRGVVPSGMLAPTGYRGTAPDPFVQSTTRPAGSLLAPSPGYDTVRVGKNRFQGKGPTGGFRPFEFAEDIGGTGAALAVTPGDTSRIEATEWLPDAADVAEGSMIISDRVHDPGFARALHEGYATAPDMGDRDPGRPLSRAMLFHPIQAFREEYRESPAMAVAAAVATVILINLLATDAEREYRARRGRGVVSATAAVPAAGIGTAGTETEKAVNDISEAADKAVGAISKASEEAVTAIKETTTEAVNTVKGAGE